MKKFSGMTLHTLMLPLTAVRIVNAAIMRAPWAWCLMCLLLGNDYYLKPKLLIAAVTAVIALVWGFLYVLTKPSIAGQAYLCRWYSVALGDMIRKRIILMIPVAATAVAVFIRVGFQGAALPVYLYSVFCIAELALNVFIINRVGNGGVNDVLDALYGPKKKKTDIGEKTADEICRESGIKDAASKKSMTNSAKNIKSNLIK